MTTIIGKQIVGYRYGEAPESGRSYNFATQSYEDGGIVTGKQIGRAHV